MPQSRTWVVVFCLLGIACNAALYGPALRLTAAGITDFMSIYSGARLAFTGGMYDLNRNMEVQQERAGWQNKSRLFLRPPFDALLVWPLGQLPYRTATALWVVLTVLAVALFCWLWPGNRTTAALVCCWSYPLFDVLADGQDIAILLLLIALAMREMRRGQAGCAGLLLSLCSIKMHLFLLLPVLILSQKRWRVASGLLAGGAVLFLASYLPAGSNWPARYAALLNNPELTNPWAAAMPSIYGLTDGMPDRGLWIGLGAAAVAFAVWLCCRRGNFEYGLAAVLTGGILVAPHAYLQDCALTIPALLITLPLAAGNWRRYFHIFLLSPFFAIGTVLNATWITATALMAYLLLLSITALQHQ